jgi:hypothetical protein
VFLSNRIELEVARAIAIVNHVIKVGIVSVHGREVSTTLSWAIF